MRVLALYFPSFELQLLERSRPELAGRAVALIAGHGDGAVVSARSGEAAARGVMVGMAASHARGRSPGMAFFPDNAGACLDELERLASILRVRATTLVAIGGRDHLLLDVSSLAQGPQAEARVARALADYIRDRGRWEVRAGVGSSRAEALTSARASRRLPLVAPAADEAVPADTPLAPFVAGTISARVALPSPSSAVAARATIARQLSKLGLILAARGESFRELRLLIERRDGDHDVGVASHQPLHEADEAIELLDGRLPDTALERARAVRVELGRLGPDVRVKRLPAGVGYVPRQAALAGLRRAG